MKKIHTLGIDVMTEHKDIVIAYLAALKSTVSVRDGGVYRECPGYSQVHVETTKSEDELDQWLYKNCHHHFEFPKDLQHPTARLCLTAAYLLEYWGKNGTIPEYTSVIAGLRADALRADALRADALRAKRRLWQLTALTKKGRSE